jgi:hypothetical protein
MAKNTSVCDFTESINRSKSAASTEYDLSSGTRQYHRKGIDKKLIFIAEAEALTKLCRGATNHVMRSTSEGALNQRWNGPVGSPRQGRRLSSTYAQDLVDENAPFETHAILACYSNSMSLYLRRGTFSLPPMDRPESRQLRRLSGHLSLLSIQYIKLLTSLPYA